MTLAAGDARPVFFRTSIRVRYGQGLLQESFHLTPKSAYYFRRRVDDNAVHLEKIGLGPRDYDEAPSEPRSHSELLSAPVISVKLLVDDDEPTHRKIWEARLRARIAIASKVLEEHSGVRLKVVAVETWESDDSQHDFSRSFREFERKVSPEPGTLAIGFSSQYRISQGRVHMGGTRGVLHPYVLLKERAPNVEETERLELLVHELGHCLGASHSPEPQSVMRPLLTGGHQRRMGARIQFDAVNTLLVAMVGDELRHHGARSVADISRSTRKRMLEIYGVLETAMPDDPAAAQYRKMVGRVTTPPLAEDTRLVLQELVRAAKLQQRGDSSENPSGARSAAALKDDALTNYYVRRAATTALRIESAHRAKAFLLAMGIFVDDTNTLRSFPSTAPFVHRVESELERRERIRLQGEPTIRGRQDLARHFFVSAHSLVVMGGAATRGIGMAKELLDARHGTGFSFADMAANRAGVIFAEQLLKGSVTIEEVGRSFSVADYMPAIAELAEGMGLDALQRRFGGKDQSSVGEELDRIEQRILELPVYAN